MDSERIGAIWEEMRPGYANVQIGELEAHTLILAFAARVAAEAAGEALERAADAIRARRDLEGPDGLLEPTARCGIDCAEAIVRELASVRTQAQESKP